MRPEDGLGGIDKASWARRRGSTSRYGKWERVAGGEASLGQQALAVSTAHGVLVVTVPRCPCAEATNQARECGGRQRLAQVSSWRAEVAFSRPRADQAVWLSAGRRWHDWQSPGEGE